MDAEGCAVWTGPRVWLWSASESKISWIIFASESSLLPPAKARFEYAQIGRTARSAGNIIHRDNRNKRLDCISLHCMVAHAACEWMCDLKGCDPYMLYDWSGCPIWTHLLTCGIHDHSSLFYSCIIAQICPRNMYISCNGFDIDWCSSTVILSYLVILN